VIALFCSSRAAPPKLETWKLVDSGSHLKDSLPHDSDSVPHIVDSKHAVNPAAQHSHRPVMSLPVVS
jgi:hypothetical protein